MSLLQDTHDVIAALPIDDAVAAVARITEALAAINGADALTLEERYDDIFLLDTATVERTRLLLREYLTTARHTIQRESALWNGAHHCWRELAKAYALCAQRYAADRAAAAGFQRLAHVAEARAIRALRRQLQWLRLRYATPGAEIWSALAHLYAAVAPDIVEQEMLIYPGESTTIQREFLKALVLAALPSENLKPQEQDLATYIVSRYASSFVMSRSADAGCTHAFDLNNPQAPLLIDRTLPPGAAVCYFGAGAAIDAIAAALRSIEQTGQAPADLRFKSPIALTLLTPVLTQIYSDWTGKTYERRHAREKSNARVSVVPGFKNFLQVLEESDADPFDFTVRDTGESWVASDISADGFGVVMPAVSGDWVSVGSVAGIEGETAGEWSVGVVRRVRRMDDGQQHIGMQVLGRATLAVRVMRDASGAAGMQITQRIPVDRAILLTADALRQKEIELLVSDAALYDAGNVYVLIGDRVLLVRLREVLESNVAYARICFTVVGLES